MITLGQTPPWCKFSDLAELPLVGTVPISFLKLGLVSDIRFRCACSFFSQLSLHLKHHPGSGASCKHRIQAEVPTIPESVCEAINLTAMASNESPKLKWVWEYLPHLIPASHVPIFQILIQPPILYSVVTHTNVCPHACTQRAC